MPTALPEAPAPSESPAAPFPAVFGAPASRPAAACASAAPPAFAPQATSTPQAHTKPAQRTNVGRDVKRSPLTAAFELSHATAPPSGATTRLNEHVVAGLYG
jgi:hypothetical protein